jgi:hypothetical protein
MFDQMIERIKGSRPLRTDDTPLETYVYSQLAEGIMIDPDDFDDAWSPIGGIPFEDVVKVGTEAAVQVNEVGANGNAAAELDRVLDRMNRAQRAFSAAFKTSMLVDEMIQVSQDDIYRSYPAGGRKVSNAYEGVITGMQAMPTPKRSSPKRSRTISWTRRVLPSGLSSRRDTSETLMRPGTTSRPKVVIGSSKPSTPSSRSVSALTTT